MSNMNTERAKLSRRRDEILSAPYEPATYDELQDLIKRIEAMPPDPDPEPEPAPPVRKTVRVKPKGR